MCRQSGHVALGRALGTPCYSGRYRAEARAALLRARTRDRAAWAGTEEQGRVGQWGRGRGGGGTGGLGAAMGGAAAGPSTTRAQEHDAVFGGV